MAVHIFKGGYMKRIIAIILILACCFGIGYLGYVIFNTKNIESVELKGNVQTIYLVDGATAPNFQDANLKVTYKSGKFDYIPLKNADISVTDFSTSIEASRNMKINYKSHIIEIPYSVIRNGLYYVGSDNIISPGNEDVNEIYSITETTEMFYLLPDGQFKYYTKTNGNWLLYDGKYITSYKYDIVDNGIRVYLGGDVAYTLTADSSSGLMEVSASRSEYNDQGMEVLRETKGLKYTGMKTNAVVDSFELSYSEGTYIDNSYFELFINETLADRRGDLFLKITYTTPLVSYTTDGQTEIPIIQTVYVVVDDSMIPANGIFDTANVTNTNRQLTLWYESLSFDLVYRVHVKV